MKKLLALVLTLVLACSLLTACGAKKEFIVGFDASFPPYGYVDEAGNYVGFDLDLAKEVCSRLGWEIKLQPIDWDSKDMELNSGNISCIWNGFTITEERLSQYEWSDAYVDNSQVFVVKAGSGISTKADLAGKVVCVQAASSALEALEGEEELMNSFAELVQVPDYNTAFLNLESGAVEAVALDIGVANYQISVRDASAYTILSEALATEQYGIGFKKGDTELRNKVQDTLYAMMEDGKFMEIATAWGLENAVIIKK